MRLKDIIGTDIVVNCKSIEEYEKLEKEYKKICKDGDGIIRKQAYYDQTCYRLTEYTMKYDSVLYYKSINHKIIQLSDLEEFSTTSENYEIHITNKGNNTYGVMKSNGEIIKRVETVKHPLDDFSFEVASEVIMDKLFDRENKEVKRKAKVGEWVKIVDAGYIPKTNGIDDYKNGDILQIIESDGNCPQYTRYGVGMATDFSERVLRESEYVVLENYNPNVEIKPTKQLSDYTNEELLAEIERRLK